MSGERSLTLLNSEDDVEIKENLNITPKLNDFSVLQFSIRMRLTMGGEAGLLTAMKIKNMNM